MNFYTDNNPIIACSTGSITNTAISVIRLSGFESLSVFKNFLSIPIKKIKPRYSHLTNIVSGDLVLDNVLMVYFPEGESYTGENVVEFSVHGNLLNVQRILDLFILEAHFRLAHPGEFTYRALRNKKLSLSQVEGLDMLLNANSSLMLSQGLDILQGELHSQYLKLYNSFLKLKSSIEISIDFSEDVGEEESRKLFLDSFNRFFEIISSLHSRTQGSISTILSPEVVLVGQTNAGKSSLFNLLVKHNRSIVSSVPGTTRDYVSEVVFINGTNYSLVDTAGVRESKDQIEVIGIDRSFEILKRSFFRILAINPFETNEIDLSKFPDLDFDLIIFSHSDLDGFKDALLAFDFSRLNCSQLCFASLKSGSIEPANFKSGSIGPTLTSNTGSIEPASSVLPGPIEPFVKGLIEKKFQSLTLNSPILLERHRAVINKTYLHSVEFSSKINEIGDVAILSSEVNIFSNYLSELIGIVSPDDVLNSIFANFCIGK